MTADVIALHAPKAAPRIWVCAACRCETWKIDENGSLTCAHCGAKSLDGPDLANGGWLAQAQRAPELDDGPGVSMCVSFNGENEDVMIDRARDWAADRARRGDTVLVLSVDAADRISLWCGARTATSRDGIALRIEAAADMVREIVIEEEIPGPTGVTPTPET